MPRWSLDRSGCTFRATTLENVKSFYLVTTNDSK